MVGVPLGQCEVSTAWAFETVGHVANHPLYRQGDHVSAAQGATALRPLFAGGRGSLVADLWHHHKVTVIKINAITVPTDSGDELARRFAARAGAVDDQDGFEGFELLKPIDDRTTWLVVTRWRDEAAFEAWVKSPAFAHGHRSASERAGEPPQNPVGIHTELWSYESAGGSGQ